MSTSAPRVVLLVPRREGIALRDRTWNWCRKWWQSNFPDWPLYEGHHDTGLFNRSAAVNTAAQLAGDWDVAVIIDADVIAHPPNVRRGVEKALETGRLIVPFRVRYNLDKPGSDRIMGGYKGNWTRYIAKRYYDQHSSVIAVSRPLWDAVGGFDEGFRGWGHEDTAFAIACESAAGPRVNLQGEVWHFWHPSSPEGKPGTPTNSANRNRVEAYKANWGDKTAIARLKDDQPEVEARLPGIPRILHRVVPEQTTEQAEAWWAEWAELHPDWLLKTHRDPLDPEEWPETAPAWPFVRAGAQLADLIRLEALYRFGGVYVDQDVQPLRSLEPLRGVEGFAAWEDEQTVPQAVIAAVPGHPAIKRCLALIVKQVQAPDDGISPSQAIWNAGPGITTKVLPGRKDFLLLPPGSFYPVHYRDPERATKLAGPFPPWTFGIHHYWGSWLKK